MDKHLKDLLPVFDQEIRTAVQRGDISGTPFMNFTDDAAAIFSGIHVIAELLQIDSLRQGMDDEEDRLLTNLQKESLLGMIRATSWRMVCDSGGTADWARKRIEATRGGDK